MTRASDILICYDGTEAADEAIREAAQVFPGAEAVVVTAWAPFETMPYAAFGAIGDIGKVDDEIEASTRQTAERGTTLARDIGLTARTETLKSTGTTARTLVERANRGDCRAVVVGTTGHTALGGAILGSVSNALIHNATIPVLVVHPSGST